MRARTLRTLLLAAAIAWPAAAWAQEGAINLLAESSFELDAVSLRLPAVSPFPIVVGGWGSRADASGAVSATSAARGGARALLIESSEDAPAHVLQDAPLAGRGFVFRASVQRRRGRQSIALAGTWDRMDPDARPLVEVEMRGNAILVSTAAGQWTLPIRVANRDWYDLELRSDPRTGLIDIAIDGTNEARVPGAAEEPLRTVILGGHRGGQRSVFRYDELQLFRLEELELDELATALRERGASASTLRRIDTARAALTRGASRLFAAEIRGLARLLRDSADASVTARIAALTEFAEIR